MHAGLGSTPETSSAALILQRVWRGVLGRRAYSAMFYAECISQMEGGASLLDVSDADSPLAPDAAARASPLSLDEVRAEATCAHLFWPTDVPRERSAPPESPQASALGASPPHTPSWPAEATKRAASPADYSHFTPEMAAGMSLDDLRELRTMLSRVTSIRKNALAATEEKRDELLRERSCRAQLIEQLLSQAPR